jgi:hypothetical protein
MNWMTAITIQTSAAKNSSGMNKNDVHSISLPANCHQGQSWIPLALSQTPCQLVAVETNPTNGMAKHNKILIPRKISLIMRMVRCIGDSLPNIPSSGGNCAYSGEALRNFHPWVLKKSPDRANQSGLEIVIFLLFHARFPDFPNLADQCRAGPECQFTGFPASGSGL